MLGRTSTSQPSHKIAADVSPTGAEAALLLASRSPRRLQLLEEHGYRVRVIESGLDDGLLRSGAVDPAQWVAALAYLKAEAGLRVLRADPALLETIQRELNDTSCPQPVILGADTTLVVDDRIVGQPCDADDARRILQRLRGRTHEVITGVALIDVTGSRRTFFCDAALVEVGGLSEEEIEQYIASGGWRGKAGAYNLRERLEAGWPIRYEGDPTTIMGLPMGRLGQALQRFCQT